jgi:hypothetical protein
VVTRLIVLAKPPRTAVGQIKKLRTWADHSIFFAARWPQETWEKGKKPTLGVDHSSGGDWRTS